MHELSQHLIGIEASIDASNSYVILDAVKELDRLSEIERSLNAIKADIIRVAVSEYTLSTLDGGVCYSEGLLDFANKVEMGEL